MSDIPPIDPTDEADSTTSSPSPAVDNGTGLGDEQLLAVLDWMRGPLGEMLSAAITEAQEAAPRVAVNSGSCIAVTVADGTTTGSSATVSMDGDDEGGEIVAQIIGDVPLPGDRVMVMFVPPSAAYVFGMVGGGGVPAGTISATVRAINAESTSSTSTAPDRGYFWPFGQVKKQNAAPNLYRVCGSRFNTGGEAADEFRLPDLRGRMLIGMDNMGGTDAGRHSLTNAVGTVGGAETHTLSTSNMPYHNHGVASHQHGYTPSGSVSITSISGSVSISGTTSSDGGHNHGVAFSGNIGNAGGVNGNFAGSDRDYASSFDGTHAHSFSGSGSLSGGSGSGSFSGYGSATDYGGPTGTDYAGSGTSVNHLPPVFVVHWQIKG